MLDRRAVQMGILVGWLATPMLASAQSRPVKYRKGEEPMGVMAEARLALGRSAQAVEIASQCLKDNPEATRCRSVLARAKASAGRCDQALPLFEQLRDSEAWTERTAMQEGLCRLRQGDFPGAIDVFAEAIDIKPSQPLTWFQRAMASVRIGDFSTFDEDITEILSAKRPGRMAEILEGWRALETGGESIDGLLAAAFASGVEDHEPQAFQQFALIDCQRWLDVGDPWEAARRARVGVKMSQGQTRLVACHGEALRRQADAHSAWYLVDRPWHRDAHSVALTAVGVRILVDLDRMDEARARMAKLPRSATSEWISSAWYLARADGDADAMARLERAWNLMPRPPGRTLQATIPVLEN